jgi:ribosome recycling factor
MSFKDKFKEQYDKFLQECVTPGQLSPNTIGGLMIDMQEYRKPLKAIANIINHSSSQIKIMPFDSSQMKSIELSVRNSNIGSVASFDKYLIVSAPQETKEQYKKILSLMKESIENTKKIMRNIRHQELKDLDEDEKKRMDKNIQKEIDEYNKMFDKKIKEFEVKYKL